MPIGTMKWLKANKSGGLIQVDDGSKDVFVQISSRMGAEYDVRKPSQQAQNVSAALKDANKQVGAFEFRHAGK